MADDNGVIFLASRAEWKYRPLTQIPSAKLAELSDARQFGQAISSDPVFSPEQGSANLGHVSGAKGADFGEYTLQRRSLPERGWTLLLFSDVADARRHAASLASTAALALVAMLLVALVAWQRGQVVRAKLEAHEALEVRVAERTAELRRTQENLIQSAKLASLGQALAGVAHEINQPLAALTTYVASSRVMLRRNEVERAAGNLDLMSSIAERMMALVQHLRMFARKETGARSAVDLARIIDNAIRLLDYRIRNERVDLVRAPPPEPVFAFVNPVRLEQVVVNLLSNAIDAMRDAERKILTVTLGRESHRAIVEIVDTGCGIAPEHIKSLFDPFFTTKEIGEGLGLGLSISYGIIRESGGDILVESAVGSGTSFKVILLAMERADAPQRSELLA
jgi:two-component system, NtrC family, C4-dicarboxylate transport sensor histidine kinase DctB